MLAPVASAAFPFSGEYRRPGGENVSVDHGIYNQQDPSEQPIFLSVVPGMTVTVRHDYLTGEKADKDWWMGQVIHCGGAARDPKVHNLFQIADVDSGVIRWLNADLVTEILLRAPGQKTPHLAGRICFFDHIPGRLLAEILVTETSAM